MSYVFIPTTLEAITKGGISMKNMHQQLSYAVGNCKAIGQKKHNAPKDVKHDGRSYSYSAHNARMETAKQFGRWMERTHPEIVMAKDIKEEHINQWLQEKAKSCRNDTLQSYASNMRCISKMVGKTFGSSLVDPNMIITPHNESKAARTVPMAAEHIQALQASYKDGSDSSAYRAIQLAHATGARVSEVVKLKASNITFKANGTATVSIIGGKGGRNRVVDVKDKQDVANLMQLCKEQPVGRFVPAAAESVNRSINRHLQQLELKSNYSHTSVHAIRKEWAQRMYDQYRLDHNKYAAIRYVNEQLGHGADRDVKLLSRYVANIH